MSLLPRLRRLTPHDPLSPDEVFEAVQEAAKTINDESRESGDALEIAIRLLEGRRLGALPSDCGIAVDFLAEECGLYPYIRPENFGFITQTTIESHSVSLREKIYLHSKQMQVLLWLQQGDNVILSAPTSFGKTLLVDAFLKRSLPRFVLIIQPTIALIDETRRRISRNFGDHYRLVTTTYDEFRDSHPTVFILTQERFLQRQDAVEFDFLFIDEFYKLDPGRDDQRYQHLNLALYKALPRSKQCFMAGPHINAITLGERWRGSFRFIQTDYRTVTVNIVDRSANKDIFSAFISDLRGVGDESSLIFTRSPPSAYDLLEKIQDAGFRYSTELGDKLAVWIAANYHPDWPVAKASSAGIAVHHGRVPRSLSQFFVQMFDRRELKAMICTSTLIEGVNTSAANVFVYDKKINRTDFDFFSFANIRGRVGRMMRHFVGNAYLYHEPPASIDTVVDVPILSNPDRATDYLLMNVERDGLSSAGQQRQDSLPGLTGLSVMVLREHGALGTPVLTDLLESVKTVLRDDAKLLLWRGMPNAEQRKVMAKLVVPVVRAQKVAFGLKTAPQVAWGWAELKRIKKLPKFLAWFVRTFAEGDEGRRVSVDEAFRFLQACEFSFPRAIAAVQDIVRQEKGYDAADYGPYYAGLENWFRPSWMKQLDESGLPLPLLERLPSAILRVTTKADVLRMLRDLSKRQMSRFDEIDNLFIKTAMEAMPQSDLE